MNSNIDIQTNTCDDTNLDVDGSLDLASIHTPDTILSFDDIIHTWKTYIDSELLPIIRGLNVTLEGNLYTSHQSFVENDNLNDKRYNIYNLLNTIKPNRVLEIGFNAGFSCLLMKLIQPNIAITCVDINKHKYVMPCYNKLTEDFDNIQLIPESSYDIALPDLIHKNESYDIIHIDGDHRYDSAKKDFNLCLQLSRPGTIIIVDDTNLIHLNKLCDEYVASGFVCEYKLADFKSTQQYKHRLLEVTNYKPPVYISLTSIFSRQKILHTTLSSLLNQTTKPNKIYLYLSETPHLLDTGFTLQQITHPPLDNLIKNNGDILKICWVENTGPYRKLLPLLKDKWTNDCIIITADDDVMYSPDLVKNLIDNYDKNKCVVAFRGFTPKHTRLAEFKYYNRKAIKTDLSLYNFATGRGSMLFKPSFFYKTNNLIFNSDIYMDKCPKADDIWFHLIRIKNNVKCYLINNLSYETKHINDIGLYKTYNSKKNTITFHNTLAKLTDLGY